MSAKTCFSYRYVVKKRHVFLIFASFRPTNPIQITAHVRHMTDNDVLKEFRGCTSPPWLRMDHGLLRHRLMHICSLYTLVCFGIPRALPEHLHSPHFLATEHTRAARVLPDPWRLQTHQRQCSCTKMIIDIDILASWPKIHRVHVCFPDSWQTSASPAHQDRSFLSQAPSSH